MVLSLTRVALALLQRTTMVQSLTRVALALLWLRSEAVPTPRPTLTAPPSAYPTATVPPTAYYVSRSTLVARYSFDDGTAAEDGDSSLDGTINGATATTGRDGSGALSFDGTDDYVEFPSAVTADIRGSNSRTICLWAVIDEWDEGALFSRADGDAAPTHVSLSTLVARYSFDDGTAAEDGDSSLDGTIAFYYGATATTGRDGSGALSFDGTDDYVEFPSAVTADIQGSNARTICLWAVIDSFSSDGGSSTTGPPPTCRTSRPWNLGDDNDGYLDGSIDEVYVYSSALDAASIQVLYDAVTPQPTNFASSGGADGSLKVQLWGADTDVALSGSDDGGWHHYCLTYDGSDWALYFDGSQAAAGTDAVNTGSDRALRLGQFWNDYFFDGSIDEVYVYSSALDAASIQVLYDAVTPQPTWNLGDDNEGYLDGSIDEVYVYSSALDAASIQVLYDAVARGRRRADADATLVARYSLRQVEPGDDNDGYLDGSIDEVYVYSSALDAASIQVLYDAVSTAPTNFALRVAGTDGSLKVQLWAADTDVALSGPTTATGITTA
ncbi:hypothetical protein SO694_00009153 [Aureococcus anophagefferens]|uniref:LamG-like jellyroll fold domain-containing protein n=1 Tax=Aureococcus anophagefferens TaxID=44056 RepID=A0ABR1GDZ9_AURAN